MLPRALLLHASGTNRDHDAARALTLSGAQPEIVPLPVLRTRRVRWADYQLLVIPGGFSYADALGAGKLLSLDLQVYFGEEVHAFVDSGKPVIGICNGFQALVRAGLLPGATRRGTRESLEEIPATLTHNANGRFECRWVTLAPGSSACVWTRDLAEPIQCPVAHGEGSFVLAEPAQLTRLRDRCQIALTYVQPDGRPADGAYPFNPNGSAGDVAGVCNLDGNVLGPMPHPENHVLEYQHPRWTRGERGGLGLPLFANGVRHATQL